MQVRFQAISLSHHTAPVDVRERFHLGEAATVQMLDQLLQVLGVEEGLVLSTCNRTEVYYVAEQDRSTEIVKMLCLEAGEADFSGAMQWFQPLEEGDAVRHLFEVSLGLQATIPGDIQISGQVKQAYALASQAKLAGPFLHRLLHTIFHASKRVQQETAWRDGAASVSYAAAALAQELAGGLAQPRVLVVGLGEMGQDVARSLDAARFASLTLVNRTAAKAQALAAELGCLSAPWESLEDAVRHADVILVAVTAEAPVIPTAFLDGLTATRKYFIDLGMPRCVAPQMEHIPGVLCYDIDEIRSRTDETLRRRLDAAPRVHEIIRQEMSGFRDWSQELSISPTIHKLKEALEQIRREEIARFLKNADEKEAELIDKVTKGMMNKIIKLPVLQLKAACKRGEAETLIDILHDLFDLEKIREENH